MCAHHVITNIGMGNIPEAKSIYLRKQIIATAIKFQVQELQVVSRWEPIQSKDLYTTVQW